MNSSRGGLRRIVSGQRRSPRGFGLFALSLEQRRVQLDKNVALADRLAFACVHRRHAPAARRARHRIARKRRMLTKVNSLAVCDA